MALRDKRTSTSVIRKQVKHARVQRDRVPKSAPEAVKAKANAKVAELLDLGFSRAPSRVALNTPKRPPYMGKVGPGNGVPGGFGKKVRLTSAAAVKKRMANLGRQRSA